MPNGSINLPVGTPVRLVGYNGDTFRVTADGTTMVDLNRSVMTTEQPQQETTGKAQQSQKTDNADDTTSATKLHIEALKAEIEALRADQRQIEHEFSAAMRKLIEAKQRELQGLLEQQKEAAATPR